MNYASTVEEISSTRRKFKISIPQNEVADAFKAAIAEIQSTAEVRGFRRGKVPTTIVRKFFESDVRKKAVERIIDQSYGHVIREANVQIVSQPHIEPTSEFAENQEFHFDAMVDVNPPIEIKGYKELTLKTSSKEITEADIESTLQNLGKALGKFSKVAQERPIAENDYVVTNMSIRIDGEINKDLSKNGFRIELGRADLLPEIKANLVGARSGETRTFQMTYPENYPEARLAGKVADVSTEIVAVEEMNLPEFNDAFAKRFGAESIESLRRSLRDSLTRTEESRRLEAFGDQIVEQVLSVNTFEVPESLVESTIDRQVAEENMRREKSAKLDPQAAEVRSKFRDAAVQNVQAILALGNIARIEGISVNDDEIGPELFALAQSMGMGVKELVQQGGRMVIDEARGRVLINKTVKHLVGLNKIEMS